MVAVGGRSNNLHSTVAQAGRAAVRDESVWRRRRARCAKSRVSCRNSSSAGITSNPWQRSCRNIRCERSYIVLRCHRRRRGRRMEIVSHRGRICATVDGKRRTRGVAAASDVRL